MKAKIKKYEYGSVVYPGLSNISLKLETPKVLPTLPKISSLQFPTPKLATPQLNIPFSIANSPSFKVKQFKYQLDNDMKQFKQELNKQLDNPSLTKQIGSAGVQVATDYLSNQLSDKLFDDSELGRGLGTLFSSGVSSAGNTISNNLIKGQFLTQGLGQNVGASLAGAGVGLAANYLGRGITSAMGDSRLGRAVGQGISTGLGTLGGAVASNLINGTKTTFQGSGLFSKVGAGAINPYALGATVLGSALGAAAGPSKEYAGRHGGITQTMDTAYDLISAGVNFIPGVGQGISAAMVLNKGLSNIFGSTDGMTVQDAILGSAFMPAPVKWLNMAGASTTGTFNNQSWQNSEKANSFMGDAFGNLQSKFDQAREEAGKTYGMFSQGTKDEAQENIDFANYAWNRILAMADQNELQNIRSQAMSSINNQRYAQKIQGGYKQTAIGKQGMKIFNNATNHNIGMRLLSGAALIDNKQMILCNVPD